MKENQNEKPKENIEKSLPEDQILRARKIPNIDKDNEELILILIAGLSELKFEIKNDSNECFSDKYLSSYTKEDLIKINELFRAYKTTEEILDEIYFIMIDNKFNLIKEEDKILLVLTTPLKSFKQIIIPIKKVILDEKQELNKLTFCIKNLNQRTVNLEKKESNEYLLSQMKELIDKKFEQFFSNQKLKNDKFLESLTIQKQNELYTPSSKDSIKFSGKLTFKQEIKNEHNGERIIALLLSRTGKLLSGGNDHNICVYNYNKEKDEFNFEKKLQGHSKDITSLIEMKKEDFILSSSDDKTIRQWCNKTFECKKIFNGHSGEVLHLLSLSDDRIVSGSGDNTLKVWQSDGQCLGTLKGHSSYVYCMIELKDGRIVSGGNDGTLRFWDLSNYKCQDNHTINGVNCWTYTNIMIYIEKEDKLLVCEKSAIKVINLKDYKITQTITNGINYLFSLCRLNDGNYIGGCDNKLIKFDGDLNYLAQVKYPKSNTRVTYSILYKENRLITADAYSYIFVWEY